jgi:uncharacterized damage-inducible protein DinB
MKSQPHLNLVHFKQWADQGLYEVVRKSFDRLSSEDSNTVLRILDHSLVVDLIFRNHLRGVRSDFRGPRSAELPDLCRLAQEAREVDDWYVSHVSDLSGSDFDRPLEFNFTSGKAARMSVGEVIEHVCLHGTYHRGQAGVILQKNGIEPNDDRLTDFLEAAYSREADKLSLSVASSD